MSTTLGVQGRLRRRVFVALWLMPAILALLGSSPVAAQEGCAAGQGANYECQNTTDCGRWGGEASLCVVPEGATYEDPGTCQVSCGRLVEDEQTIPDPSRCAYGETCTLGELREGGYGYFCRPGDFALDLNLVDACVRYFVEGPGPKVAGDNQCSLVRNLNMMLDRERNGRFNIYDVDLCVRDFLEQPACTSFDPITHVCRDGGLHCAADDDCGEGLYCHEEFQRCERECGFLVDRASPSSSVGAEAPLTERACERSLTECNLKRGKCEPVELEGRSCQIDRDCPAGAYCLVGQCEPKCYRNLDCPGADWYCSSSNTCLPKPPAGTGPDFTPDAYAVNFARSSVALDPVNTQVDVPLVIMDIARKAQVRSLPRAVFGYRLEITYQRKQSDICIGDLKKIEDERVQKDCVIDQGEGEAFLIPDRPFGTIYGVGEPRLGFRLNHGAVQKLSAGHWAATVTAIFDNGRTTSLKVTFDKPSPNGLYRGTVSVFVGADNLLGTSPMGMSLNVSTENETWLWDRDVLKANNLQRDREFVDINEGLAVRGVIHAGDSMLFNAPGALSDADNLIPVKGIYSARYKRMRLIGVIDVAKDGRWCRRGSCANGPQDGLDVRNDFERPIRRIVEFIGPYNETARAFSGVYRETYQGLMPEESTLDGGFEIRQVEQHDVFAHAARLVPPLATANTRVAFPELEGAGSLLEQIDAEILSACGTDTGTDCDPNSTCLFDTNATFQSYLDGEKYPVLSHMVNFKGEVADAIKSIGGAAGGGSQAALSLADYFRGELGFCEETPKPNTCIYQSEARCGLALYRKAVLKGFVDASSAIAEAAPDATEALPPLFCSGIPGLGNASGTECAAYARTAQGDNKASRNVVALQEHNRFYSLLSQAHAFTAGNRVSDGFFALFRAQDAGDFFGAASAYSYKERMLIEALAHYDAARKLFLSATATHTMLTWPMQSFATRGQVWIKQMQSVSQERLSTLTELFDLKRRILSSQSPNDFLFVNHLLHQEYLTQVYLALLQQRWQGSELRYEGDGPKFIENGNVLLARVSDSRNPLGLYPRRTYFENDDVTVLNWQNFRNNIRQGKPYSIESVRGLIGDAREDLREALTQTQNLDTTLLVERQQIDATLDELCGPAYTLPPACDVSFEEKQLAEKCTGEGCPVEVVCADPECEQVTQQFKRTTGELQEVACRTDTKPYRIYYTDDPDRETEGDEFETSRACTHGRVGSLLQERVKLDLQRKQTVRRVQSLLRAIGNQYRYMQDTTKAYTELNEFLEENNRVVKQLNDDLAIAEEHYEMMTNVASLFDCILIAGTAGGGNCQTKGIGIAEVAVAIGLKFATLGPIRHSLADAELEKAMRLNDFEMNQSIAKFKQELDSLVTEVEGLGAEYEMTTQQLFNVDVELQDTLFQAQRHADRYREKIEQVADHLVGNLRVSPLVQNRQVRTANAQFQRLLLETYKMTQAYIHYYNLEGVDAENLVNEVYSLTTVDDVDAFVTSIETEKDEYYRRMRLDPDVFNNTHTVSFSLRELLFPDLVSQIDSAAGTSTTVEQQFHNLLMSAPFFTRVVSSGGRVEQRVEIPFAIWMDDRGDEKTSPRARLFPRTECNHVLAAPSGEKTIAVDAKVSNEPLNAKLKILLSRGTTEHIRSCTSLNAAGDKNVKVYQMGNSYWEQQDASAQGPLGVEPIGFDACVNRHDGLADTSVPPACWFNFARDRSVGAPDWKLIIPELEPGGANAWLLTATSDGAKRRLDDIRVFFRLTKVDKQ